MKVIHITRPAWFAQAGCRGTSPAAFFPARHHPTHAARDLCARCSVRSDCLRYALADDALDGIWGGTTYAQRVQMRRRAL